MANKYIVKNCPAIITSDGYFCSDDSCTCEDNEYCLVKQVINKCREVQCPCPHIGAYCYECPIGAERDFASKIMELFEIEEVNNNA